MPEEFSAIESTFEQIQPIWREKLWPERESAIEPASAIAPNGCIDSAWLQAHALFWHVPSAAGETDETDEITAVISLLVKDDSARVRGLWVHPALRGQGIARKLIQHALLEARKLGARQAWTMARHSAIGFYSSVGFATYAETDAYEYGPHALMRINL